MRSIPDIFAHKIINTMTKSISSNLKCMFLSKRIPTVKECTHP